MGIFSSGKDKQIKALSKAVIALQNQNITSWGANINRNIAVYPTWDINTSAERFCTTDDVYSIVRMLTTTAAMIPYYGYEIKEEKTYKELKRLKRPHDNVKRVKELITKGLEDLPETDKVAELLENPHEIYSKFEFNEIIHSFLYLNGECFLYKNRPDFGVNAGKPTKLLFLFPQNVVMRISETMPRTIVAYDYMVNGVKVYENLAPEDVIHIKYFNPQLGFMGEELRGLSPLQVLKKRLVRMDSEMDVSVAQMQNGGVPGIVFDKSVDSQNIEVIGQRKDNFLRYLSNSNNKGAPYFASGEMDYIELGLKLADLQVADLAKIDFKKLCNAFGVSDVLFNNDAASTESNVQIMQKRLYTNTVLPNVYRVRDALIKGLLNDFSEDIYKVDGEGNRQLVSKGDKKKRWIECDLSEITELQEDISKQVTGLLSAYWLTPNEKREAMKFDRYEDELFDKPLIPAGLQTLDDLNAVNDIPLVTPNGN